MRILLAIHNAYTDGNSGAARSVKTLIAWLTDAGHDCRVLCTARFDANPPDSLTDHLARLGITPRQSEASPSPGRSEPAGNRRSAPCDALHYSVDGVPVLQVHTRCNDSRAPDRSEYEQLVRLFDACFQSFQPDLVMSYGPHPVVREFLRRAKALGATTVLTVRNHGYDDPRYFQYADNVLAASPWLAQRYRDAVAIDCTGIPSPISWRDVQATNPNPRFLTFVNPRPAKGLALFARLADMLCSRRDDIPIMVMQSAAGAGLLNSLPEFDFSRYPQLMAAPATAAPADYLALTKLLLVPSLFEEPFGRVAVEAMINGIPPLVSDRGALPETVGTGGEVLHTPDWLHQQASGIPSEAEMEHWYSVVCTLWTDDESYAAASARAAAEARSRYGEENLRSRYEHYFTEALAHPGAIDQSNGRRKT